MFIMYPNSKFYICSCNESLAVAVKLKEILHVPIFLHFAKKPYESCILYKCLLPRIISGSDIHFSSFKRMSSQKVLNGF